MRYSFGSKILQAASRLLAPFILLFALYVLVHGHSSPGGGFQGGALLASSTILYRIVHGKKLLQMVSIEFMLIMATTGVLVYAAIGIIPMFLGGNFLDYGYLPIAGKISEVRAWGTMGIEIGITLAVAGVMILIYDSLTGNK